MHVQNEGNFTEDVVLESYVKDHDSPYATPNASLCGITHVVLAPGEGKDVSLTIPKERFLSVNEQGDRVMAGHRYTLYLGLSQPDARSTSPHGSKAGGNRSLVGKRWFLQKVLTNPGKFCKLK